MNCEGLDRANYKMHTAIIIIDSNATFLSFTPDTYTYAQRLSQKIYPMVLKLCLFFSYSHSYLSTKIARLGHDGCGDVVGPTGCGCSRGKSHSPVQLSACVPSFLPPVPTAADRNHQSIITSLHLLSTSRRLKHISRSHRRCF